MNSKTTILVLTLIVILSVLSSCNKDEISGDIITDNDQISNIINMSTDTLTYSGHPYYIRTDISRNMTPGGFNRRDRSLFASIELVNADSTVASTNLNMDKLYVIKGNEMWVSDLSDATDWNPEYIINKISKHGPEWDTGILVDVVVHLFDNVTGVSCLLIERDVEIIAVE